MFFKYTFFLLLFLLPCYSMQMMKNDCQSSNDRIFFALIILGCAIFLLRSWEGIILEDTVRYASIAKSIITTNDWLTLHQTPSVRYFNKPPLYFWLTALLFKLFGVSVWGVRFWSALAGIGSMLLLFDFINLYRNRLEAMLGALVLGLSNDFLRYTAVGRLDGPQAFFMILVIWGFARTTRNNEKWGQFIPGLGLGLGFLNKGPLVLCMLAVILLAACRQVSLRKALGVRFWSGIFFGFLLILPWHLAVAKVNPDFWAQYFGHEMLGRIKSEWLESKSRLIFVRVLLEHYLPWTIFAVSGLYQVLKSLKNKITLPQPETIKICSSDSLKKNEAEFTKDQEYKILLLAWLGITLFATFLPPRMYGRYLVPVFPPLACFSALALRSLLPVKILLWLKEKLLYLSLGLALLIMVIPFNRHKSDTDYKLHEVSGYVKTLLPAKQKLPLFLVTIHAPEATVYFYCNRETEILNNPAQSSARLILTSGGGMAQLRKFGYEPLVSAKKLVLARRRKIE